MGLLTRNKANQPEQFAFLSIVVRDKKVKLHGANELTAETMDYIIATLINYAHEQFPEVLDPNNGKKPE